LLAPCFDDWRLPHIKWVVNHIKWGYAQLMKTQHLDWAAVRAAALKLGVKPKTIDRWREPDRGIPFKWWLAIEREAGGKVSLKALAHSRDDTP
jgi:DNA-binding transcriptional regulator YdaS (Cro superfamily)